MPTNDSSLDFAKLHRKFNITDKAIQSSNFSKDDLSAIYSDYLQRLPELERLKNEFITRYIVTANNLHIHSYNGRVKDPYHLIEKIVRKCHTNDEKYGNMNTTDYFKYITDLIGCRILLVYKDSWTDVHNYLVNVFPNDPQKYTDDKHYARSYDCTPKSERNPFMAECPVAYTREGDNETLYQSVNDVVIKRPGYYRSVHYIVRYGEYYVEIQVRTLFEEAWGEVDHDRLYPLYKDNRALVDFSSILNRTAGLGDELSAYFKNTISRPVPAHSGLLLDVPIQFNSWSPAAPAESTPDLVDPHSSEAAGFDTTEAVTPDKTLNMLVFGAPYDEEV